MMWEIIEGTFWEAYFQNKLPICPKLEQNVMILGAKFSIFFSNYNPQTHINHKMMTCQIKFPNLYLYGENWMSNKTLEDLLSKPISQSRLKMAKIKHFSNEIQVSLNHIQSEIFKILGIYNQKSLSCGQDEPHRTPKSHILDVQ